MVVLKLDCWTKLTHSHHTGAHMMFWDHMDSMMGQQLVSSVLLFLLTLEQHPGLSIGSLEWVASLSMIMGVIATTLTTGFVLMSA